MHRLTVSTIAAGTLVTGLALPTAAVAAPAPLTSAAVVVPSAAAAARTQAAVEVAERARFAVAREAHRALRPGGRVMVISRGAPQGLKALLGTREPAVPAFDPAPLLAAGGFAGARLLADKEGLVFVEALKPRK